MHDFDKFPELRNSELDFYYFDSPHKQIFESFWALCVKVHDADTITVRWDEREFTFPIRLIGIDAPELNAEGGHEAQSWLEALILNKEVFIEIDRKQRVGKWGRILGVVHADGFNINELSMSERMAVPFTKRREDQLPNLDKELRIEKWF